MNIEDVYRTLEPLIDMVVSIDSETVRKYVDATYSGNPKLTKRQVAEKIINDVSMLNGLLGAGTGMLGVVTLPVTIPADLAKAWKLQACLIRCIAYIYGYDEHNTDLKTNILLLFSNDSLDELQKMVLKAGQSHLSATSESMKKVVVKKTSEAVPKYAAKAIVKCGGKNITGYVLKGVPKHLVKTLWKVGGRKILEKSIQKSVSKAVPLIGAFTGFLFDWSATQTIGHLAIEFYEKNIPKWLETQFK